MLFRHISYIIVHRDAGMYRIHFGTIVLSQDKLFNIGTYNLKLGATANVSGASGTRYIQTSGNAGDGGLTKVYSSTAAFGFPVGAPSTGHAVANFTPASIGFGTAPSVYGSITVVPVGYEHPNATNKNILIANATSDANDLFLNGKLSVINGNVYVGPVNGTTVNNNDIEYSGSGVSGIDVLGGRLIVNGQIRRNPATTTIRHD